MEQLRAAATAWGTGASIGLFARSQADDPVARKAQARFERESASPAMARALIESLMLTDVESLLARISVPTLVVHRTGDIVPWRRDGLSPAASPPASSGSFPAWTTGPG